MILILGRFQPLHNGHMKLIRESAGDDRELVIAIGSAGRKDEKDNPFSGDERKEMLRRALEAEGIHARVVLVPNLPSDEGYVEHVVEHIGGRPAKVVTENPWTIDLFSEAGYDVDVTDRHFELSATDIRRRIAEGRQWEDLVPDEVAGFIEEVRGVERIRGLFQAGS